MSNASIISFSGLASGIDTTSVIQKYTQIAQQPIVQVQNTEGGYNAQMSTWQTFNTQLGALQAAANALTQPSNFNSASATSSDITVASITAQTGAAVGDHSLTVTQLAQAQKIVSNSFASGNIALGQSGSFVLNGKAIALAASDSLTDVAAKINSAQSGVTASVVNVGANDYRLTLSSSATGAANTISVADTGAGAILSSLGLVSAGSAGIRQTLNPDAAHAGAGSLALGSATQTIANTLGLTTGSAPSGTVHIAGTTGGADIAINFGTDSLNDIANKINAANVGGVTAEVVSLPDASGNPGKHQLQILSSNTTTAGGTTTVAPPTFTDSSNILATLGIVQNSFANAPITNAQDAKFTLDGLAFTRPANTINDAIAGTSIKLLKAGTTGTPATTTLSLSQDTTTPSTLIGAFATAYNAIQDFVTQQNQFTAPTGAKGTAGNSPPLFGNTTLSQVQNQLSQALNAVSGSTTLGSIGITLNGTGDLQVDSNALTTALQNNPGQVANLFGRSGIAENPNVQFITATGKTQATTGTGYAINITQAATQTTELAAVMQTAVSAAPETLTFTGTLFSSAVSLTLPTGNSLQDTVNQINSDSSLNSLLYASVDPTTGALKIASQAYGNATGFGVTSDKATDSVGHANSGIGISGGALSAATTYGRDVAGTINGEPATGMGRTLTGNSGNAHTEGLQLLVTGGASGSLGHVSVTHGIADSISTALTQIMDPVNGSVIGAENSLTSQISDAQKQIIELTAQVSAYTDYLTQTFSDMETRVSELQSQGNAFAAQIGATTNNNNTTKKTA